MNTNIEDMTFCEFLKKQIDEAKENLSKDRRTSKTLSDSPFVVDLNGSDITFEQYDALFEDDEELIKYLNKIPQKDYKKISLLIRKELDLYNNDVLNKVGKKWSKQRTNNPQKLRKKTIRNIKNLRKCIESIHEEESFKNNPTQKEYFKDKEYYRLSEILDDFLKALEINTKEYKPHLGIGIKTDYIYLPPYKFFAPPKSSKKRLEKLFKNIRKEYNLKGSSTTFKTLLDNI